MESRHTALSFSTAACLPCFFTSPVFPPPLPITFLSGNDVDLIKIFIEFYKIISYIPFPGALQGGGKVGERERRREYIKNEVGKGNILFYSEMIFPG